MIGHVDHGKTALVRALTGMETDRLPEEQRRGISIALGFAHLRVGETEIDLIDLPGHERFVRTMVSGATGVAAVMLIVASNEGIKPQTIEHVDIAALLGVRCALAVVTKTDLVSEAQALSAGEAAGDLLRRSGLDAPPPILTSVVNGEGLDDVRNALAELAAKAEPLSDDGFPYLPIDRAFTVAGRGTVVTGTLRRGVLDPDEPLVLTHTGEEARIRELQVHGAPADRASPGQRVAVNLRGIEAGSLGRGLALAPAGLLEPSAWLAVELRATADSPPLKTGARCALLFGTTEVEARVRLLDRDALEPGATALAQLSCAPGVSVPARERFILRIPSPALTIGGGRILDPQSRRLKRNDADVLRSLAPLFAYDPAAIVRGMVEQAGEAGVPLMRLVQLSGLSPARVEAALHGDHAVLAPGGTVASREAMQAVQTRLLALLQSQLESQPNGIARRRLTSALPGVGSAVLDAVIAVLSTAGRVRQDGGSLRLTPGAADAKARAAREAALLAGVEALLLQGGLSPPDPALAAPTLEARRALDRLVRDGVAIRTYDRVQKREVLFHRDAVANARTRLAPLLEQPGLLVKDAGLALGVSRKYSVPLLEYLDVIQFTRRLGDRRVLGPAART